MHRKRFINLSFIFVLICFLSFFASYTTEEMQDNTEELLTCAVRFDANGGTIQWYQKEVKLGTIYGGMPIAKRNSYDFLGWYRKKTKINTDTVLYTGRDHVLCAKWLGTPSLDVNWEEDYVAVRCSRLGDASGVYLYMNDVRYDSSKRDETSGELKWMIKKSGDDYIFSTNLVDSVRYTCYAQAYYEENGERRVGAKSERLTFDNKDTIYTTFQKEDLQNINAMPMGNYYVTGKNRINRWATENLTPQGICSTSKYILITGYGPKEAKITVLDKRTKKGLVVLGLNEKLLELKLGGTELLGHVGGIAYDETRKAIWVSGISKRNIIRIELKTIDKYVDRANRFSNVFELKNEKDFTIYKTAYMDTNGKTKYAVPSFLEYEGGYLYIGTFKQNEPGYLRKFKLCTRNCLELIEEKTIPNKIQGAVFTEAGELILSQSYGRKNPSKLYVYKGKEKELRTYELSHVVTNIPPMTEELMIQKDKLYILFESSAKRYRKDCPDVQEYLWAVDLEKITELSQENIY